MAELGDLVICPEWFSCPRQKCSHRELHHAIESCLVEAAGNSCGCMCTVIKMPQEKWEEVELTPKGGN